MSKSEQETVWHGRTWSLKVKEYETAGGPVETAYIDHPGAVVLVPLVESAQNASILMLHQYRPALEQTILEVPAGTRGWQEPWLVCAQRELREETGYRAAEFVSLGNCWPAPGISNEQMAIFLAKGLTHDPLPQDSDEEILVEAYTLATLVEMALDGSLLDAKSVVAILRAAHHLQDATGPAAGRGHSPIE